MIHPSTKVTDSNPDMMKDLRATLQALENSFVSIGVHEDAGKYTSGKNPPDVVEVAFWTEFGTRFMPERSWLRAAVDENQSVIDRWREELLPQILDGKITVEKGLEIMGFRMQVLIQNKIKSNVPPPNAPSTLEQKRRDGVGDSTLIHTGLMLRSVTYKVVMG